MTDPLDVLAQLRPDSGIAPDWVDSHAGQLCLQRARTAAAADMPPTRPGRSRRFKTVAGAATAAVVLAGAATAYGFASRTPSDPGQVMCFRTASIDGDGTGYQLRDATPQAALEQCATHWTQAWPGTPTPAAFAVCVYPVRDNNLGGGQVVIPLSKPADATSCQTAGFDPLG